MHFIPNPKIAVDLFMIVSGFLMMDNLTIRENVEPISDKKNCLKFWLRRYFRIAPAYYASLIFAVLVRDYYLNGYEVLRNISPEKWASDSIYNPMRISYSLKNIFFHISLMFGLHPKYSFSTMLPDWSLSLEMQFYLFFPFFFVMMKKFGTLKITLIFGLSSGVFFTIYLYLIKIKILSDAFSYYEPSFLFFKLNYFIIGVLLFEIMILEKKGLKFKFHIITALLLSILEFRYRFELILLPSLVLIMLYFIGVQNNVLVTYPLVKKILNSKIVKFSSDISYSVYLFHGFFISFCGLTLFSSGRFLILSSMQRVALMWIVVFVGSYVSGYFLFRSVELPGVKLGRKFINHIM